MIATRNRAHALGPCLGAIGAQTYPALEVIVADDGSSEATLAEYAALGQTLGKRLRWLLPRHPDAPGTGPGAARNRGLRAATGSYVAFCDDDDIWIRADHVATAVRALEETGADFFFANVIATRDGRESEDYRLLPEVERLSRGTPVSRNPEIFAPDLATVMQVAGRSVIHPDVWMVRMTLIREAGEFWERLWFDEDYNMMMRVLDRTRGILFRTDACAEYRLPVSGAVSLSTSTMEKLLLQLVATQHARMACGQPLMRRHARAREAWAFRQLARELRTEGRPGEARRFAWQGLCTYPTLGAVRDLLFG